MISDARNGHVSPGIYTEEKDVTYSVKSLGITSLGLVGETLYGPAFEKIEIENWSEFVDYFGGTSPEKFKGTGLPKYELPYDAKEYLSESKRLTVVRVLGLSGYHAGPAYIIKDKESNLPLVILRSKMTYDGASDNICEAKPDKATEVVKSIEISPYQTAVYTSECVETSSATTIDNSLYKFQIKVTTNPSNGYNDEYVYNVSLISTDTDYIYKVLSSSPETGSTPIYIEAVYESSLISGATASVVPTVKSGKVYTTTYWVKSQESGSSVTYSKIEDISNVDAKIFAPISSGVVIDSATTAFTASSAVVSNKYVSYVTSGVEEYLYDDFREEYRPAQTPWIVSQISANISGDNVTATAKKLFKFITISDGNAANYQVKVSIQNIKPADGVFDVVVRDYNDTDAAPVILEKFSKCSLVEGDASYIGYKIGTSDGGYITKSKYITVEMADAEDLSNCIPAGFLGYPMPKYGCDKTISANYNTEFKPSLKAKKQYFGIVTDADSYASEYVFDTDILAYKGKYFYDNAGDADPDMITNGFHMDSLFAHYGSAMTCYIDGASGFNFTSVSTAKVTTDTYEPRLINASYINQTIYKDVNVRKFTVMFYGGFDGWDVNRTYRTNGDEYKATRYAVSRTDNSGAFSYVSENGLNESLNLPSTAITTDYYAYLAGYKKFANPQDADINLFATPGINWYDNELLTEEVIDVIEDADDGRGGDALYVMASPTDMTPDELATEFESTEINSSYACTYYPWIMYYDSSNKKYLNLPPTKDVLRNMAATDNTSYPWFAPAGIERGSVNCVKPVYKMNLSNEDTLYEVGVNPLKSFAQDGVKVWGNKTTYSEESPINRINVRRLMIRVKKLVSDAAKNLIFDQYDTSLEKQFRSLIDPILSDVQSNRGIYAYRIDTECTEETRDQHILPAKILIKPTPALEYISISFVVYPESVEFEEN